MNSSMKAILYMWYVHVVNHHSFGFKSPQNYDYMGVVWVEAKHRSAVPSSTSSIISMCTKELSSSSSPFFQLSGQDRSI